MVAAQFRETLIVLTINNLAYNNIYVLPSRFKAQNRGMPDILQALHYYQNHNSNLIDWSIEHI